MFYFVRLKNKAVLKGFVLSFNAVKVVIIHINRRPLLPIISHLLIRHIFIFSWLLGAWRENMSRMFLLLIALPLPFLNIPLTHWVNRLLPDGVDDGAVGELLPEDEQRMRKVYFPWTHLLKPNKASGPTVAGHSSEHHGADGYGSTAWCYEPRSVRTRLWEDVFTLFQGPSFRGLSGERLLRRAGRSWRARLRKPSSTTRRCHSAPAWAGAGISSRAFRGLTWRIATSMTSDISEWSHTLWSRFSYVSLNPCFRIQHFLEFQRLNWFESKIFKKKKTKDHQTEKEKPDRFCVADFISLFSNE